MGQVSAAPGTVFEAAEKSDEWVRVLLGEKASAWMSSSAQGMSLLEPAQRRVFVMNPEVRCRWVCVVCENLEGAGYGNIDVYIDI